MTVFGDGNAELWDMRTREVSRRFDNVKMEFNEDKEAKDFIRYGFEGHSLPLFFLQGGKGMATVHEDDIVRFWDLTSSSRTPKSELPLQKHKIERVVFSPMDRICSDWPRTIQALYGSSPAESRS